MLEKFQSRLGTTLHSDTAIVGSHSFTAVFQSRLGTTLHSDLKAKKDD